MSDHWRLALWYAAWLLGLAALVSVVLFLVYGGVHAWSFLYGAGAAVLSFVSTALTISLFAGRSMAAGVMIGGASFVVRLVFAAAVLGIPAYLGLWPVVPMLAGFAGVYVAENLSSAKSRATSREGAGRRAGN